MIKKPSLLSAADTVRADSQKTANKNAGITKQAADAIRQYRLIIPEKQP
ncbi:hypothetical protein AALB53_04795 [Lachnospiraceae bacterium 47-T17]